MASRRDDCGDMMTPARRNPRASMLMSPMAAELSTQEPSPAQVFDMAAEDDDPCSVFSAGCSPSSSIEPVRKACFGLLDSCSEADKSKTQALPSMASDCRASTAEEVDAWDMEDWGSPASITKHSSSMCSEARAFDIKQQEVADAVREELQVDLEAIVHRAIDQMRSWVSEEIAFARQGFEDSMQKAFVELRDQRAHEEAQLVASLRIDHDRETAMIRKIEDNLNLQQLQQSVDNQMRMIRDLQDSTQTPADDCIPRQTGASDRVLEARRVADERRWRLRIDALQESLDKHSDRIHRLEVRSGDFAERLSGYDSDIHKGIKSIQKAEAQLAVDGEERRSLEASVGKLGERLDVVDKRSKDHELQIAQHVIELQNNSATWRQHSENIQDLQSRCCSVSKVFGVQESRLEESIEALKQLEIQVTMSEKEFHGSVQQIRKTVEVLEKSALDFGEKVASHETILSSGEDSMRTLEVRIIASETAQTAMQASLQEQSEKMQACDQRASILTSRVDAHHAEMQETVCALRQLEVQLAAAEKECLAELQVVCEQINGHETGLKDLVAKVDNKADSNVLLEALVSRDSRITDMSSKLVELAAEDGKLGNRISELVTLVEQLRGGVSQLDAITEKIACIEVNLVEGLAEKAAASDVDKTVLALQTWADEAREAMHQWLAASLEHFKATIEGHSGSLHRHEAWIRTLNDWIEQVRVREQGLTHVILHMIEESPPELLGLLEDALTVPRLPKLMLDY